MKRIALLLLLITMPFINGCAVAVVGAAGAAAGYEAHKAGYRINITKETPGQKPVEKNQKK